MSVLGLEAGTADVAANERGAGGSREIAAKHNPCQGEMASVDRTACHGHLIQNHLPRLLSAPTPPAISPPTSYPPSPIPKKAFVLPRSLNRCSGTHCIPYIQAFQWDNHQRHCKSIPHTHHCHCLILRCALPPSPAARHCLPFAGALVAIITHRLLSRHRTVNWQQYQYQYQSISRSSHVSILPLRIKHSLTSLAGSTRFSNTKPPPPQ